MLTHRHANSSLMPSMRRALYRIEILFHCFTPFTQLMVLWHNMNSQNHGIPRKLFKSTLNKGLLIYLSTVRAKVLKM